MGVMIIPFVSSISDDVINAVPQNLKNGSLGIGATKSETILKVIVPAALPGIIGGLLVSMYFDGMTLNDYILGIRFDFKMFSITYALIKSVFFAFIITSIPSYFGYYVKGGALEIGKASTKSVVYSSITILIINYLLTQMLLVW